jgi:heme-degrading monooxygenase HmoA
MTARIWHGVVPESKSDEYLEIQKRYGIKDYKSVEGNRGVFVFRRNEGGNTHFLLLTLWDSEDSIRRFAGDEMEIARYYPDDKDFLLEMEPYVTHYEVAMMPGDDK